MRLIDLRANRATYIANVLALYRSCSEQDRVLGLTWYTNAIGCVLTLANRYDVPSETVACVIAACSPQCYWDENLRAAECVLVGRNDNTRALPSCLRKAEAILRDRATDTVPYFPHGPKVCSFASNLQGYTDTVTVDTHAAQAALHNPTASIRLCWTHYAVFADCYRNAAMHVGIVPCDFQAIVWHTWKRLFPATHKRALLRHSKNRGIYATPLYR